MLILSVPNPLDVIHSEARLNAWPKDDATVHPPPKLSEGVRKAIKITREQAARQGDTLLTIGCETPRRAAARLGHAVNNGGHHPDIAMNEALNRWGPLRRLNDIRAVCTVCGGRTIDIHSRHRPIPGKQGV